jgi:nijmegen breakage syndrome protein 1
MFQQNSRSRSRCIIKDLDTKIGSFLEGEQIRGQSRVLEREENVVILGRYKDSFRYDNAPA